MFQDDDVKIKYTRNNEALSAQICNWTMQKENTIKSLKSQLIPHFLQPLISDPHSVAIVTI